MEIWAHRGCSLKHPENTIESFEAAAKLPGLCGIELDIQISKDNKLVVIHDETLERTTARFGNVKDFTFTEMESFSKIPSLEQVLDLLKSYMLRGLKLNIELKNSKVPYDGMEQMVLDLIRNYGLESQVVYSSFNADSMRKLKEIDDSANVAVLGKSALDCLNAATYNVHCEAIHPYIRNLDCPTFALEDMDVRVWTKDHLYPKEPFLDIKHNLDALKRKGATGIFVNNPEDYLKII